MISGEHSVPHPRNESTCSKTMGSRPKGSADRRALQVDVKLFKLALRSYPELFQCEPKVTFEQHFLSLIAAAQRNTSRHRSAAR